MTTKVEVIGEENKAQRSQLSWPITHRGAKITSVGAQLHRCPAHQIYKVFHSSLLIILSLIRGARHVSTMENWPVDCASVTRAFEGLKNFSSMDLGDFIWCCISGKSGPTGCHGNRAAAHKLISCGVIIPSP